MLAPTPYHMPVKVDKAESGKNKGGLHSEGMLDTVSWEIKVPPSEDKSEGEVNISSPHGKKRAASEKWEGRSSKRGKMPPSSGSGSEGDAVEQLHHEGKPSTKP